MKDTLLTGIFRKKPPETLYHYTSQTGMLGIVENKEIWATHTQYMNDQREYLHALDLVEKEIRKRINSTADRDIRYQLDEMCQGIQGIESMNVCVCSFSAVRDSLPQWRTYGGSTSGYAIGVSGDFLSTIVERERFYLAPCLYKENDQLELVQAIVGLVLEENLERDRKQEKVYLPRGGNLCAYLHRYAPILKDKAFSVEEEWRIISHPLACTFERFSYRSGNSMIIPYYRIPLTTESGQINIKEVVVGPTPHIKQSVNSVHSFLVKHDLRDVEVIPSKVPYRNW